LKSELEAKSAADDKLKENTKVVAAVPSTPTINENLSEDEKLKIRLKEKQTSSYNALLEKVTD
jgi:hypothetical protein